MLILLRHGRTPVNAAARLQGDLDAELDEVGIAQATRAGNYIRDRWDIDAVVTTSLRRSRQTAEHAGFESADHTIDDRWREIGFGEFEDRPVAASVQDLASRWAADIEYRPVGGESLASLHRRVADACVDFTDRAASRHILVVSHATPIKSAVIWATGGHPAMILNLWVDPGSVSVLGRMHGNLVLAEFNRKVDDAR